MSYVIDYVLEGTDKVLGGPEGMTVQCVNGPDKPAEDVIAGDKIMIHGASGTVAEVGRTLVNDDGSRGDRVILGEEK